MPFVTGESGNPAGRPPGARNKKTLLIEAMLDAEAEGLTRRVIAKALEGDTGALRLCLDRLQPRGGDRPVPFALPPIENSSDTRKAVGMIRAAIGTGEITPREAIALLRVVEKCTQVIAAADAAERAAMRAQPPGWLQALQQEFEQRLAQEGKAEGAEIDRAVAEQVDASAASPPTGVAPTPQATIAQPVAPARDAIAGKNNGRGNNKNTMMAGPPFAVQRQQPWTAPAGALQGGPPWDRDRPVFAAPPGLRRQLAGLMAASR
jgi:hypothetical protein